MSRLDEATAAATAGELTDPGMIGTACCYLIRACEQVHDYDRAAQWCERVREFCPPLEVHPPLFRLPHSVRIVAHPARRVGRGRAGDRSAAPARGTGAAPGRAHRPDPARRPAPPSGTLGRGGSRCWPRAGAHYLAVLGRAALALDRGESGPGSGAGRGISPAGTGRMTAPSGYPDWTC